MNKLKKIMLTVVTSLIAVTSSLAAVSCDQIEGLLPDLIPGFGHTHTLTKVEGVDATCTEAGRETYFKCDGCDKIFSDINGTNEIEAPKTIAALGHKITGVAGTDATCTEDGTGDAFKCTRCNTLFSDKKGEHVIEHAPVIKANGHELVETKAKDATCTENGNKAYWTCTTCKKVFSDGEGKNETTVADQTIVAKGHDLTKTKAKPVGCTTDGNIEYWTCGTCENVYADEKCEKKITLADTVIKAQGHIYEETLLVEGAVTTYEPGENFKTNNLVVKLACSNCNHKETITDYTLSKSENLQPADTSIVISYVKDGKTYTATVKITVIHVHTTGELIPAVEAKCTETGTLAYYECSVCKAKFEDKAATKLLEDIVVPAKGHNPTKTEAQESTCTEAGHNAYWTCDDCEKVFSDKECTQETTVEDQMLDLAKHDTEVKSDDEGHWYACKNCDYTTDKENHTGVAYPDEAAKCTVCGKTFAEASWTGWVLYRPSVKPGGDLIKSASHVDVNGIKASQYVFKAAAAGTESNTWPSSEKDEYKSGLYQVRIPTYNNDRALYVYVANNNDFEVSFRMYSENYGDKGGVDITLAANESGWFKFTVNSGYTIGCNVNFKLLSDLESEATITVYGYFHLAEEEIANLKAANEQSLKLSYEVGEKFDLSKLILAANVATNEEGELLADGGNVETYYIANNFKVEGFANGYTFTSEDEGAHTVTVSFGGKSFTLTVTVSSHKHVLQLVEKKAATCTEDGYEAYYVCNVNGCEQKFADAEGKTPITEITVIPAGHIASTALPGEKAVCPRCGEESGEIRDAAGWMHFVPAAYTSITSSLDTVNGNLATVYTIPAGTKAETKYNFETHHEDDNSKNGKYQVRVPLQGERKLIVYIANLSGVDATVKFGDDNFKGYATLTVLGNSYAAAEFTLNLNTEGPWMGLQLLTDVPEGEDLKLAIYGYMYIEEGEENLSDLKVIQDATTLAFKPGSTFSSEGLILGASHKAPLYIRTGFTTDLDGHVFTAAESGKKTVTVTFAGLTTTYEIEVLDHTHEGEKVEGKEMIQCQEDGYEAYYTCKVEGCNKMFSDAECTKEIEAPIVIPCHSGVALPGHKAVCEHCGKAFGEVLNGKNWVYYNMTTNKGSSTDVVNGDLKAENVEGMSGTKIYIGTGTKAGNKFQLCMGDNDANRQTVIPNLGSGAPEGALRNVVLFYKNYSNQAVTLNLQNDANGGNGSVTIPANGTATVEFTIKNQGGSNWFFLYVDNDITEDVVIGVYGYLYVHDGEISELSVAKSANKVSFAEGDTFTAEGLALSAKMPSSNTKTLYVTTGFTTDLDGYTFTAADVAAGKKTVTVTFAGVTMTYEVAVTAHAHQLEKVEKAMVECVSDGFETYWKCTVDGCDAIFSDANGSNRLAAPIVIPCHENIGIPGTTETCSKCEHEYVVSTYNWVYYNVTTQKGGETNVVDGKLEAADVVGMSGTKITIGAGTTEGSKFQLCMNNNDTDRQTVIPNLSNGAADGDVRTVVLFYKNYSNQAVTLNLQNDNHGGNGSVTIPANGTAICQFDVTNKGGSNWFYLYIDSAVTEEVVIGVYGYFYVNSGEVSNLSINKPATKLTYKVGDTFSTEGLALDAVLPSGTTKTVYATTGFITNFDGHTFTAAEVGTHTVLVTFAGVTIEYEITVEA